MLLCVYMANLLQQFVQSIMNDVSQPKTHAKAQNGAVSNAANVASNYLVGMPLRNYAEGLTNPNSQYATPAAEATMPYFLGSGELKAVEPLANAGIDMAVNGGKAVVGDISKGVSDTMEHAQTQPGGLQAGFVKVPGATEEAPATATFQPSQLPQKLPNEITHIPQEAGTGFSQTPTGEVYWTNPGQPISYTPVAQPSAGLKIGGMGSAPPAVPEALPPTPLNPQAEFQPGSTIPKTEMPATPGQLPQTPPTTLTGTKPSSLLNKAVGVGGKILAGGTGLAASLYGLKELGIPVDQAFPYGAALVQNAMQPKTNQTSASDTNGKTTYSYPSPISNGTIMDQKDYTDKTNTLTQKIGSEKMTDPIQAQKDQASLDSLTNTYNSQSGVRNAWQNYNQVIQNSNTAVSMLSKIPQSIFSLNGDYRAMLAANNGEYASFVNVLKQIQDQTGAPILTAQNASTVKQMLDTIVNKTEKTKYVSVLNTYENPTQSQVDSGNTEQPTMPATPQTIPSGSDQPFTIPGFNTVGAGLPALQ